MSPIPAIGFTFGVRYHRTLNVERLSASSHRPNVQGYFSPVGLTDEGQLQFMSATDRGSDFSQLPGL